MRTLIPLLAVVALVGCKNDEMKTPIVPATGMAATPTTSLAKSEKVIKLSNDFGVAALGPTTMPAVTARRDSINFSYDVPATTYGTPSPDNGAEYITVATLLKNPAAYQDKLVRITGNVTEVCEKKGCFVRLAEGDLKENLFVKFTCPIDGERLIPVNAVGKYAIVEGKLVVKEISEDTARHYAEDAGKTEAEVEAIKGPQKLVTLASPAATIIN